MIAPDAKLHDEPGRIAALYRYEVLDTPREEPFEKITGLVRTILNVPIATVSLIDTDRQWYKSCVGMESVELPRQQSFCTHTIQSRDPLAIPDTQLDPRFAHYPSVVGEPYIRSYLGIPLASPDGYNLGSLCALDRQPRTFEPAQIEVMKSFAALVVDELELRRIAQTDSLTGAANRRSFLVSLSQSIQNFQHDGTPSTLLALDIDHFKRVNDTFGHATGDSVLRNVSQTLRSFLRPEDTLGRLGGEEFGVVLAGRGLHEAANIAESLRQAVQESSLSGLSHKVTASFGISTIADEQLRPETWLARADEALYRAKRSGRNQCCVEVSDHAVREVSLAAG